MTPSRMLTSRFAESHNALLGKGANVAMKKRKLLMLGLACALVFAVGARGDAAEEIGRLAELMGWRAGTIAADIGAGGGKYTFAAVERVGGAGKGYAAEIDGEEQGGLREEGARRKLWDG